MKHPFSKSTLSKTNNKHYDPVIFRVVDILHKLHNDERPTMEELTIEYNVTLRTIQTDIYKRLAPFEIKKDSLKRLMLG
jgi:hypothetical protein